MARFDCACLITFGDPCGANWRPVNENGEETCLYDGHRKACHDIIMGLADAAPTKPKEIPDAPDDPDRTTD